MYIDKVSQCLQEVLKSLQDVSQNIQGVSENFEVLFKQQNHIFSHFSKSIIPINTFSIVDGSFLKSTHFVIFSKAQLSWYMRYEQKCFLNVLYIFRQCLKICRECLKRFRPFSWELEGSICKYTESTPKLSNFTYCYIQNQFQYHQKICS